MKQCKKIWKKACLPLLLGFCMLFAGCQSPELDPENYDLPDDAQTEVRDGGYLWVIKQQPEKVLPLTLPEGENFYVRSYAPDVCLDFDAKWGHYKEIIHAYCDGEYYIGFEDVKWLYAREGDGSYTLWKSENGGAFVRERERESEAAAKAWFYADLTEGSISLAMLCGVWGEPTGNTKDVFVYSEEIYGNVVVSCKEYNHHGILQYADPETGLCLELFARCMMIDKAREAHTVGGLNEAYGDMSSSLLYVAKEGEDLWARITNGGTRPVLG